MGRTLGEVTTSKLVKMYGPTRALAGVSLTFSAGTITGLEGANGSGKSTLVSLLAQLSQPTRGTIRYGSLPDKRVRGQIGLLSHSAMVYPSLSGRANLEFFASLYGVENAKKRIDELIERFDIGKYVERPTSTYSRGQLQRVALSRALLHRPQLVLLDEPSTGLDDAATDRLAEAIVEEKKRGAILVLVTHDPDLAARVCDQRVRLARGKVVTE